jgi:ubiquinone/menaquinone biosynthesis C-methylase UbiE
MDETVPTIAELALGVEGLALLRTLYGPSAATRAARLTESRTILDEAEEPPYDQAVGVELDVGAGYRDWSRTYDRPLRLFSIEEPPMLRLVDEVPAGDALDVGCGSGRYAVHLHRRGHRVTGVDQSAAMLELARGKLPDVTFREGELGELPVDAGSFDLAVCALCLVHAEDLHRPFAELGRVLRPGGTAVISDVHPMLVALGWQAQFPTDRGRAFMRLHHHLASDYVAAASAAGLSLLSFEEPTLTEATVITPTSELIPDATRLAYLGLPGVVVWAFRRGAGPGADDG